MDKAQSFRRYIRNQEAFADWFLWKLLFTIIRTFFAAHAHKFIVLGKRFLKFLILFVIIIKKRFHGKAERMALVSSRSSNQCHVQDRAFHPTSFNLCKVCVADTDCYCREDGCGNVVSRIVMAFVYFTDDALNLSREYADWKFYTSQSWTQINRFINDRYRIDRTWIHTIDD